MSQIIPALITYDDSPDNDFKELKNKFDKLEPFLAEFDNWVQIDITDGKFVETKTNINLEDFKYFTARANVEFHLMTDRPEETVGEWIRIGAKRIIVHIEAITDLKKLLSVCRENNVEVGLALNPETPNIIIEPWINSVDLILFLGVKPGRGGQEFIPSVLEKLKSLRQNFPNAKIEIDGGVRKENIKELKETGVDLFVIGSGILKALNVSQAIQDLKSAISY